MLFKIKTIRLVISFLFLALSAASGFASNDMWIYTQQLNNGWQDWGWVPHYPTNSPSFNGSNSVAFEASSTYQAWYLEHDPLNGTLFTKVSIWLNGGPTGGQTVGIQAENGSTWGTQIQVKAPTNSWQQFTFTLASLGVANSTNFNAIEIWNGGTLQSPFYIADITLVAAPTPAVVHVGVNVTNSLRTVDPRVFGVNTAAWDSDLNTPGTISVLTNLNTQSLRWPGGSWGDIFFMTNSYNSSTASFIHVATNVHAQVYFIVNYGSGTSNQAAAWVRYCNITNNCAFKYWEVGNENYGSWEEDINTNLAYFGQEAIHDPWTYAMRFKDYYNAMKAVDPGIKVGAVALPDEVSYANDTNHPAVNPVTGTTNYGWTAVMLNTMRTNGVTPDFLTEHSYAPADGDLYNLLWTKQWVTDSANLRQIVNDYLGVAAGTNVELVDTEFGPEGDKQWISLVGGLFAADAIGNVLQTQFNSFLWWDLRNGQSTVTGSDNALYGWRTNSAGAILTDEGCINGNVTPPGANCYPSYYCMKLVKYFAGGGDQVIKVTNDCPYLGTYGVLRTNGTLTLLIINKSSCSNLTASVNIAGYLPATNAITYSYGIPQDNAAQTGIGSTDILQTNSVVGPTFSNTFAPYSATVLVLNPAPATPVNLVVSSGLNPEVYGNPVTLTATVETNGVPVGSLGGETLTFYNGATLLGSATLNLGGQASYTTTAGQLGAGVASVFAVYAGDSLYLAGTNLTAFSQTVNPATLTAGLTGTVAKNYDRTTTASLGSGNYTLAGVLAGDTVTLNDPSTGTYDTQNQGAAKTVTVTGLTINGSSATNYLLANSSASAAVGLIYPTNLTVTAASDTKTYDATTNASTLPVITAGSLQGGDTAAFVETYDTPDVGGSKTLTPGGLVNDGNGGSNYNYSFVPGASGTITAATLTYTATPADIAYGSSVPALGGSVGGFVGGDTLATATTGTMIFSTTATAASGVGAYAINGSGLLANANNYTFAQAPGNAVALTITPATVTVTNLFALDKVYDGTTNATLNATNAGLSGILNGDGVILITSNSSAYFADANVGAAKPVSVVGLSLGDDAATNYLLMAPTNVTASILPLVTPVFGSPAFSLGAGGLQLTFNAQPGQSYRVLASSNLGLPLSQWTVLTNLIFGPSGTATFIDSSTTNLPLRFYQIGSP